MVHRAAGAHWLFRQVSPRRSQAPSHTHYLGALHHTNNTGELTAAAEAFIDCLHREPQPTVWKYDSELTASTARGTQAIAEEKKLCSTVRKLFRRANAHLILHGGLRTEHIYSHFKHKGNAAADRAAERGVTQTCTIGRYSATYAHHAYDSHLITSPEALPARPDVDISEQWTLI